MSTARREEQLDRVWRVIAILEKRDPDALEAWLRKLEALAEDARGDLRPS